MSNLYLCPDDYWRCPIDLNHQVLAKRFQYHVRRCMIANPHIQRVRCVFNANHLTTPDQLFAHMSTCPDAINTSTVLIGLSDMRRNEPLPDNCRRSSTPTDRRMFYDVTATEDWDDDIYERRAKSAVNNEEMIASPPAQLFTTSPRDIQQFHEKQQENSERHIYKPVATSRQAHVLKKHDHHGQMHPTETDDLTKKLTKIRTLQLIGGAGRGACCLLGTNPPAPGFPSRK